MGISFNRQGGNVFAQHIGLLSVREVTKALENTLMRLGDEAKIGKKSAIYLEQRTSTHAPAGLRET